MYLFDVKQCPLSFESSNALRHLLAKRFVVFRIAKNPLQVLQLNADLDAREYGEKIHELIAAIIHTSSTAFFVRSSLHRAQGPLDTTTSRTRLRLRLYASARRVNDRRASSNVRLLSIGTFVGRDPSVSLVQETPANTQ